VIELDLRRLDDSEPPVATEQRLGASIVRGQALRRKHNLLAMTTASMALVLVIALGGLIGLVRTPATVSPAGQTSSTAAEAPPSPVPYELSADGIDPYLIGADADLLQKQGLLAAPRTPVSCPAAYLPLGKYAKDPLRMGATGRQIDLVVASGRVFHTPSLATVGMTYDDLHRKFAAEQLVQVPTKGFEQAYTVGRLNVVGFALTKGQVRLLVAGPKAVVTKLLQDGTLASC
jgi:hypothetical protein